MVPFILLCTALLMQLEVQQEAAHGTFYIIVYTPKP